MSPQNKSHNYDTLVPATQNISGTKGKSLQERSIVPSSFYIMVTTIVLLHYLCGIYDAQNAVQWWETIQTGGVTLYQYALDSWTLLVNNDSTQQQQQVVSTLISWSMILSLAGVFFVAPFLGGFWTGRRATRHLVHRYMGLLYLIQYTAAWIEFFTAYDTTGKHSLLPHTVALNGLIQGMSAYMSFKVLPELTDPGFYSDKAVLSRSFVHENLYFTFLAAMGTLYNYEPFRTTLQSAGPLARVVEYCFVFFPYVLIRPFFPTTRFSNAGLTRNGRTTLNMRFYQLGTTAVKIFYLWAKYLLGFFVNYLIFLNGIDNHRHWRVLHGLLLLNTGTVSLAVFLHTLRFRKVLPAKFTFSVYLGQIYLTFSAIPLGYDLFLEHPLLVAICMAGVACNMTRRKDVHAVWCLACMALLMNNRDYAWLGRKLEL